MIKLLHRNESHVCSSFYAVYIPLKDFEKVLKVVEDKAFSKISGVAVDLFTASFIKSVYDNVNDKNKKCMEDMSIANLIGVAQTLMSK